MTDPLQPIGSGAELTLDQRTFSSPRQTTPYIQCGPADGPLMIFVHGWPSISLMWRAQMGAFAADGWHCVAPDLRGYGGSSTPAANDAYTIEEIVTAMAELHDHLGGKPAIWVGHDWGCVVVGELVAHQPKRSRGVVLTSLAYQPDGHALRTIVPLVDRTIYPADQYPDGQWDYYRYYNTHFEGAVADLDADLQHRWRRSFGQATPPASARFRRMRWSRAMEGALAPRTAPRRLNLIRLSGRRRTSTCWCRRSGFTASVPPARGT
jgi:pimeloyl-ACP methyl ester carboxylesterase